MTKIDLLQEDILCVFNTLHMNYNINMVAKPKGPNIVFYYGDAFFSSGHYIVLIEVHLDYSIVKVFKMCANTQSCVFQKKYSTLSDVHALSKSVSLFKFLNTLALGK